MGFYDLSKEHRSGLVAKISSAIRNELSTGSLEKTIAYFSDEDTYIRKAYLSLGRIYLANPELNKEIEKTLRYLFTSEDFNVRHKQQLMLPGRSERWTSLLSSPSSTKGYLITIIQ